MRLLRFVLKTIKDDCSENAAWGIFYTQSHSIWYTLNKHRSAVLSLAAVSSIFNINNRRRPAHTDNFPLLLEVVMIFFFSYWQGMRVRNRERERAAWHHHRKGTNMDLRWTQIHAKCWPKLSMNRRFATKFKRSLTKSAGGAWHRHSYFHFMEN